MTTNLPERQIEDSAAGTKLFFDNYGEEPLQYNATDVDAALAFFTGRGFDQDAAIVVATTILRQSKLDNTPVYKILDSLSGFNGLEISTIVGEILNNDRTPTSTLGFRVDSAKPNQTRNIAA